MVEITSFDVLIVIALDSDSLTSSMCVEGYVTVVCRSVEVGAVCDSVWSVSLLLWGGSWLGDAAWPVEGGGLG